MVTIDKGTEQVKVLIISDIMVQGKPREEGEMLTLSKLDARHLQACNKVMLGTDQELQAAAKEIQARKKAEADEAAKRVGKA